MEIIFSCKKCGHELHMGLDSEWSAPQIMRKMNMLCSMACPACGEEAWHNWILEQVVLSRAGR